MEEFNNWILYCTVFQIGIMTLDESTTIKLSGERDADWWDNMIGRKVWIIMKVMDEEGHKREGEKETTGSEGPL